VFDSSSADLSVIANGVSLLNTAADLEQVLDTTPVLLVRCTSDLRYRYVSKSYAAMLGRTPDEFAGKPIIDIIGPEWFEAIRPHVERVLRGEQVEYEATFSFAGAGLRHLHVTLVPERDDQGEVVGWVASITDITEYKRATEQLTHILRVGTLEGLSGAIAHELSQPIASILANAQAAQMKLAKKDCDLEGVSEILRDIIEADIRAEQVIRTLRGLLIRGEHSETSINLNELLESTLQLLRSELSKRQIRVNTELQSQLSQVSGDPVELQQVLINLIMNAAEAMASVAPSERTLSIVTRNTDEGNVELSMTDRGPGMPPTELKRLFEPFFTTKKGGLGLGLSICRNIVRAHHGDITLRNTSGGGLEATVSLPRSGQLGAPS
jgi:PAS domain S-box-containing protein